MLVTVIVVARELPPQRNASNDKEKRHGAKILAALFRVRIRSSIVYGKQSNKEALRRVQGVKSVFMSFSAQ